MHRRTRFMAPAALALLVGCSPNFWERTDLAFDGSGEVIRGEFIISADLSEAEMSGFALEKIDYNPVLGAGLYNSDDGIALEELQWAMGMGSRGGASVEFNRPRAAYSVNDPYRSYQWSFDQLDMEAAWTESTGAGVTVAVVDTGVFARGDDTPVNLLPGWDFIGDDGDPSDNVGHGTHVAGTIAQATNNGRGCAGVAYDAAILPVKVLGNNGGSAYTVAEGIVWAVDEGAEVINLSLGSSYGSSVEENALEYAASKGVIVVAATGNEGRNSVSYPARYEQAIAVGATRYDKQAPAYSNGGSAIDIAAPGGDTSRDQNGDGYYDGILQEAAEGGSPEYLFYDGTSMATPHVAGLAALLLSAGAHPDDVRGLITNTAEDLGAPGWDSTYGHGLIDPVAALAAIETGGPAEPPPVEEPVDGDPPEISGVGGSRNGTSLTLYWTTDEPASSEIEFEGYGRYGDPNALVTDHELRFTINAGSTFVFTLISVDEAGNEAVSSRWETRP